jgi:ankyrin repeat protein
MLTMSYNIDKYLLPNFIDIQATINMAITNKYCKNIINNCKRIENIKIDEKISTLFETACYTKKIHQIKLLIKLDINPWALFTLCFRNFFDDCANFIINSGYDINRKIRTGTVLHYACSYGHAKCTNILIENGINLNTQDNYGCTALHDACRGNKYECAKILLKAGANINILNTDGQTAFDVAKKWNNIECINLFSTRNANYIPPPTTTKST